ncbi:RecQ family ATP-dependent DNA helicase [Streptomyces antimicrobicus]|uniref:ATP-dependent DNA helicase RecQ n=1 Tax=Streptomyces antimicrobicus TaxID=2883108 RepID=A0ABS8B042_9ACTN|nr:ATP-dependent DNA helicase RecQ [Streptomyces antimicrobicus]MCB5177975.1 ATP-dependent DNA helicase [Streptomyces antimicrobicus]
MAGGKQDSRKEAPGKEDRGTQAPGKADPGTEDPGTEDTPAGIRFEATAAEVFGWETLRPGQRTAMEAVVAGRDTLVVMPTGAGKSAVYQVAALCLPGPTVVVSPLLALQRDQIAGLLRHGAPDGVAVNSDQAPRRTAAAWEAVRDGRAEFLFLSPEQLANDDVVESLAATAPALFVVDEAHCVSTWGHDFRPAYMRLAQVLPRLGRPTVLALTATAAPPVREEIVERLGMRDPVLVVAGFDRPNITLEVRRFAEEQDRRRAVVERAAAEPKPGLVYAATRKDSERYAADLAGLGLAAAAYHSGLDAAHRSRVHDAFLASELDVVVATSAFGMGIDKENVRFVLHAALPGSLDAYYQEIGRAGRDGAPSAAVLYYRPQDTGMQNFFAARGPAEDTLVEVATTLHQHEEPLALDDLREETGLSRHRATAAANLLEQAGAANTGDDGTIAPVPHIPADEAAARAGEAAAARRRLDRSRVEMMRAYAETTGCRRRFLLGYFGEEHDGACGNCDVCAPARSDAEEAPGPGPVPGPRPAAKPEADTDRETETDPGSTAHPAAGDFPAGTRVRHRAWGPGMVLSEDGDRITVLFDSMGYRTLSLAAVTAHGLLRPLP